MAPTLQILIRVYAHNEVGKVRKDKAVLEQAFGKTLDELDADIEFSPMRDFVAQLKQDVELHRDQWRVADRMAQIGTCLRMVWECVQFGEYPKSTIDLRADVLKELFLEIFRGKWTPMQVAHVEFVVDILKSWKSFFLSYTNRSARSTNDTYKAVIESCVESTVRSTRNWDTDNLLADAVLGVLSRENLFHGFYDKVNIQVSDDLEQKIGPAAGGSFMFVQLVQPETFSAPPPPPPQMRNWCFEEYKIFQVCNERVLQPRPSYRELFRRRFAPLVTEPNAPALLPFQYQAWVTRAFKEQRFERVPVTPDAFRGVVHKLACEIVSLHTQIIECVPT